MTILLHSLLLMITLIVGASVQQTVYAVKEGSILFVSEAPLETIRATSKEPKGALNTADNTFAFSVHNRSFHGFNSALQEEHFNENYMESDKYPNSTFTGKIIEDVDLTQDGTYEVRAKGNLDVHGVKQERILKCTVTTRANTVNIKSDFTVLLEDHKINIPRIVNQKLFPEIKVTVDLTMQPK
jgi:hypothetical protein